MPITLISGPANAGKAELVMDAVRRHVAHGEEPLLVVPTRADAEHYLRELAGSGSAMGVRVERFAGLTAEAVRRAGIAEPPLGAVARERVLEAIAARAGAPSTPGFVRALGEVFAELQVARVTPPRLSRALASLSGAQPDAQPGASAGGADGAEAHAAGLGPLFAEYRATLGRLGRVDAEQRAVRALDALRERPALWSRTPVLFYGFDDLTRLQLDAIETLGRVVDADVTVSLAYEPGRTAFAGRAASFHALAPLASEQRQLPPRAEHYARRSRGALSHLERSLFEPRAPAAGRVEPGDAVRLLEGGGERAELELVAAEIGALLGEGMAPAEIAVLVRAGGTDPDLLEEVFSACAIPFALRRPHPFADSAIGRALIGLLRCVPAPEPSLADTQADGPEEGAEPHAGELEDLLAWLRAPGLLAHGSARGAGPTLADRLEITARRAGAASAAQARALWEERNWPLEAIDRLAEAQARGPGALCERAARELYWLFCAPRRAAASVLEADELGEAQALAAGRRALGELRELARMASALAPATARELASTLGRLELAGGAGGAEGPGQAAGAGAAPGPHGQAGAVAVLDPLALRARRVRVLFVCGLQEGVFPARARPQPFLGEEERRRLAEVSGLRLGEQEDVLAAERYLLYAAVSRPEERLYLSWHVADDEGEATSRSLFVDDVCDLFSEDLRDARLERPLGALDASPAQVARGGVAQGMTPRSTPGKPTADGVLHDERLLTQLREHVWSPSSLERWIGCPVSWFVERMLRPDAFEADPEPLARGGLAHAALKATLEQLRLETGSARLTPASLPRARELLARALVENEAQYQLSVTPERRVAVRRRLQCDLERYLEHAADPASPLEPLELELGFGFAEGEPLARAGEPGEGEELPALDLGGGVRLRGRIDRVDVGEHGEAVVYDYKGGRAPAGARWVKDGSVQVALYMRAVETLLRRPIAGGFYQPLTGEDLRARGVLDGDAGIELDTVRSDALEHDELRELLDQTVALALEAAGEAGRGELEPRPHTCAFRGGCMYPTICRCER
ncbi:MAG TPA: PD-(D/E)XK nuclease family protein [Solirubrobacteraceae bacterium]|jgi:ATP-dependent helicase/DNAse subunit B|nr:PD-(D/E)XK nuclease family protein [Solirubrobacteraceae bacterium]